MDIIKWSIKKAVERNDKKEVARLLRKCCSTTNFDPEEWNLLADFIESDIPKKVGRPKESNPFRDMRLMLIYGVEYLSRAGTDEFKNKEEAQQAFCEEKLGIGGFHNGTFIKLYKRYGHIARIFLPEKKK